MPSLQELARLLCRYENSFFPGPSARLPACLPTPRSYSWMARLGRCCTIRLFTSPDEDELLDGRKGRVRSPSASRRCSCSVGSQEKPPVSTVAVLCGGMQPLIYAVPVARYRIVSYRSQASILSRRADDMPSGCLNRYNCPSVMRVLFGFRII